MGNAGQGHQGLLPSATQGLSAPCESAARRTDIYGGVVVPVYIGPNGQREFEEISVVTHAPEPITSRFIEPTITPAEARRLQFASRRMVYDVTEKERAASVENSVRANRARRLSEAGRERMREAGRRSGLARNRGVRDALEQRRLENARRAVELMAAFGGDLRAVGLAMGMRPNNVANVLKSAQRRGVA